MQTASGENAAVARAGSEITEYIIASGEALYEMLGRQMCAALGNSCRNAGVFVAHHAPVDRMPQNSIVSRVVSVLNKLLVLDSGRSYLLGEPSTDFRRHAREGHAHGWREPYRLSHRGLRIAPQLKRSTTPLV